MRITLVGHAALLIEAGGFTILSDPWWRGPCFGAQWWNYPPPHLRVLEGMRLDFIYISHGHHDHFHPGTLKGLDRSAKVLVSERTDLAPGVSELGFDVIRVPDREEHRLGGDVAVRIIHTHGGDTLMAVSDGKEVALNLNDALHSAPRSVQDDFVATLRSIYPRIDYVFCGYGVASHFPNCYVIPGKDRVRTAQRRQRYFNGQWARLVASLSPRFAFPFAADVVFLEEDLFWVNEPTHNAERPTALFRQLYPKSLVQVRDIGPGFALQDGSILREVLREPVSAAKLRETYADAIERANRYGAEDPAEVSEVFALLEANLDTCRAYLESFPDSYRFVIRFRQATEAVQVEKAGGTVRLSLASLDAALAARPDLIYTTRVSYLKWSLTRPHGEEILFVGSGGIFEYRDPARARNNLHRELMTLLRRHAKAVPPRPRPKPKLVALARSAVKRLLGRHRPDLYDLRTWSVFTR